MKPEDKRAHFRVSLEMPISIEAQDERFEGTIKNLSASGMLFYLDRALAEGVEIEFSLTIPAELTLTYPLPVIGKGRVVRVQKEPDGRIGIAADIYSYDLVTCHSAVIEAEVERYSRRDWL